MYYHHYCDIPILQKYNNQTWIILDLRVNRKVLKLIKHLNNMGVEFYFNSKALNANQDLETPESKSEIVRNYMNALFVEVFFDGIR
jgi:hypothetical protein